MNVDAIGLLLVMMENHYKNFESIDEEELKKDAEHHVDSILESLIIKIGEDNAELKEKSIETLKKISKYPLTDFVAQINKLMMEKRINDHGHSVGRMVLLQNLIQKHKITP